MNTRIPIALGLALLCLSPARARQAGVYDVTASLSGHELPGLLDLVRMGDELAGRLRVTTPRLTVHIALRGKEGEFRTGAPAHGFRATFDGDTFTGSIMMAADHEVTLVGQRNDSRSPDEEMLRQLRMAPYGDGTISTAGLGEIFPTFTPNDRTMYFGRYEIDFQKQTVMMARRDGGDWTAPTIASFSGQHTDRSPFVSPDGRRLYFASKRPHQTGNEAREDYDIWIAALDDDGTAESPHPCTALNSQANDYQLTQSGSGEMVFTSEREGGQGHQDLYLASQGRSLTVENLGPTINSDDSEMSGYIDPDGQWIIVATARQLEGSFGNDDLYITFRTGSGWS